MRTKDEQRTDEKRIAILKCAQEIMKLEGIEKLSIRKIANKLHQTPGILYHYYENKEAILFAVIAQEYQEILRTIQQYSDIVDVVERMKKTLHAYMHLMCEKDILFTLLMSSKNPLVRQQIDILTPEAMQRKSIQFLYQSIRTGVDEHIFICDDILLTTQWIWTSMYGVIATLIHEQASEDMKTRLIHQHVTYIMKCLERNSNL